MNAEDAGAIDAHIRNAHGFEKADAEHYDALLHGSIRDVLSLRADLTPLIDRSLDQLSPIEHAALLIGAYELRHHIEIPYRVVINEAVELTKSFGGIDGHKYVNGVLDKLAANLRSLEVNAAR
jgi:N utilization substance protein B